MRFTVWVHNIEEAVWWEKELSEQQARQLLAEGVSGVCLNGQPWFGDLPDIASPTSPAVESNREVDELERLFGAVEP